MTTPADWRLTLQQDAPEPMMRPEVESVTPQDLVDHSVALLADLPVDVYASDVNHGGGVYYRSQVAEPLLSFPDSFRSRDTARLADRLQSLFAAGTDPIEIYCRACHDAGIAYAARLRMNDLHDVVGHHMQTDRPRHGPDGELGEPYFYTSRFKTEHPHLLLGDVTDDTPPPASLEYWERYAFNYALGPAREHIYAMAAELVDGYDIDLLELDFIRFTVLFRRAEAYAQRHVLTAFVRRLRELCRAAGQRRGRPLYLSARVPDSAELGLRAGIDTEAWLREGLLDLLVIGGGYSPFTTPFDELAGLASECGVPAHACLNHNRFAKDPRRVRAGALRAFESGASGLTLWNFWYCFDYYHPPGENPMDLSCTHGLDDRDTLARSELVFPLDPYWDPTEFVGAVHSHHSCPGQVPLTIGRADDGIGQSVVFDLPAAAITARGAHTNALLTLNVENYWAPEDRLELRWNGQLLSGVEQQLRANQGREPYRLSAAVPGTELIAGANRLELRLTAFHTRVDPFVRLLDGELRLVARQ